MQDLSFTVREEQTVDSVGRPAVYWAFRPKSSARLVRVQMKAQAELVPHSRKMSRPEVLAWRLRGVVVVSKRARWWGNMHDAWVSSMLETWATGVAARAKGIQLMGLVAEPGRIPAMIMPCMEHGSLAQYLLANQECDRRQLTIGAVEGVCFLHKENIAHGDIKPDNVFVDKDGSLRLGDFGSACIDGIWVSLDRTVEYCAPEIFREHGPATLPGDVWSSGMLAMAVLTDGSPWAHVKLREPGLRLVFKHRPSRPDTFGDRLWAALQHAWEESPDKRPTAVGLLRELTAAL